MGYGFMASLFRTLRALDLGCRVEVFGLSFYGLLRKIRGIPCP